MDASSLREIQAPLREQYRTDPATARTRLGARGDFRDHGITCTVDGWVLRAWSRPHTPAKQRAIRGATGDALCAQYSKSSRFCPPPQDSRSIGSRG